MNGIFPTFEEIDKGHCVFTQTLYRGLNDDGEPKFGEKLDLEIVIAHNTYVELINGIYIIRNRKHEKKGFRFELAGNKYAYSFEYTAEGWDACVNKIKVILNFYKRSIDKLLGEIDKLLGEEE